MANRPSEISYDDLNGEECLEILHTRFYDLLHDLPELQRRFALNRVIMRIEISLDVWGASPPKKIYHDKVQIHTLRQPLTEPEHSDQTLSAEIDSRNNPPDQIREEHGLPLPRMVRGQAGMLETHPVDPEDEPKYPKPPAPLPTNLLPANLPNPNARDFTGTEYQNIVPAAGKGRRYVTVVQDYGSLQSKSRKGDEGPIVGDPDKGNPSGGADVAPVQVDFRLQSFKGDPQELVNETIQKVQEIDKKIERERHLGYERRNNK